MKTAIIVLAVLSLMAFASGEFAVIDGATSDEVSVQTPGTDADWLVYDQDSAKYLNWSKYKGVWFNTEDFVAGSTGGTMLTVGTWFWNNGGDHDWDTDEFYLEIWSGDELMPDEMIVQKEGVAVHKDVCEVDFTDATVTVDNNFWVVVNCNHFSTGGWPSLLSDEFGDVHSFASSDGSTWASYHDWHIRAYVELATGSFENSTWGSIKATF